MSEPRRSRALPKTCRSTGADGLSNGSPLQRVRTLCAEFSIEIVPCNVYPQPGQTRAVATIGRIIDKRGEPHARLVLSTLAETKGNQGLLDEVSLWAVSDLITACSRWVEERTSDWLDAWDRLPLGRFMYLVRELAGVTVQRHALAGLCYAFLRAVLEPEHTMTAVRAKTDCARGIVPPSYCEAA